jgi:hypothetical protein
MKHHNPAAQMAYVLVTTDGTSFTGHQTPRFITTSLDVAEAWKNSNQGSWEPRNYWVLPMIHDVEIPGQTL